MIYVKCCFLRILGQEAVFTDLAGSLTYLLDQSRGDVGAQMLFP